MHNSQFSMNNETSGIAGEYAKSSHAWNKVPDASLNFSIAKVIAIFTVVAGHWFTGTILWIPVTFGLFVFAFSSAYFTSKRYGSTVDQRRFWRKKLERLWIRFWVVLAFLSILLFAVGKPVVHWHSVLHFFGLSGVLNWFGITNRSGLGAGLWFFTLLLLFYFTYPSLAKLGKHRTAAGFITAIGAVVAMFLDSSVKVGHELWFTSFGFVLGVMYGLHEPRAGGRAAFFLSVLWCCLLLMLNLFTSLKIFNSILILAASISISVWLSKAKFPSSQVVRNIAKLEDYLLEIFLIHTYLFFRVSGNTVLDFVASLLPIIVIAVFLNRLVAWLSTRLLARKALK